MVSAYVAWQLVDAGLSYWVALPLTVAAAFGAGALAQRLVMRWAGDAALITTIGLYVFVHALAAQIWSSALRTFPNPFPARSGSSARWAWWPACSRCSTWSSGTVGRA